MAEIPVNAVVEVIAVGNDSGSEVMNRYFVRNRVLKTSEEQFALFFKDRILWDNCAVMSSQMSWHTLKIRMHTAQGYTPYVIVPIGAVLGRWGAAPGAHQVAGVMTLRVKANGARRDGRIYIPSIPHNVFINNAWNAGYLDVAQALCLSNTTRYGTGGTETHMHWLVKSFNVGGAHEYFTLKKAEWQSQPGVIRRRRVETI